MAKFAGAEIKIILVPHGFEIDYEAHLEDGTVIEQGACRDFAGNLENHQKVFHAIVDFLRQLDEVEKVTRGTLL